MSKRKPVEPVVHPGVETVAPTLGRIVLYTDAEGKVSPAIVTEITSNGEVHVCAFDSVFGPRNFLTSGEGSEAGCWAWPPKA